MLCGCILGHNFVGCTVYYGRETKAEGFYKIDEQMSDFCHYLYRMMFVKGLFLFASSSVIKHLLQDIYLQRRPTPAQWTIFEILGHYIFGKT